MRLFDLPPAGIDETTLGGVPALHAAPGEPSVHAPLLFVHGAFTHAGCWLNLLPWLAARGFDVWALHLPGHQPDADPSTLHALSLDDYAVAVAQAVRSLPAPPVLLGHSMGAVVARLVAAQAEIAGLALLSPVPRGGTAASALRLAAQHPLYLPAATAFNWSMPLSAEWRSEMGAVLFGDAPSGLSEDTQRQLFRPESFRVLQELWWLAWRRLPPAPVPCMVVGGTADAMFPVEAFEDTARELHAQLTLLPDQPHAWMLSRDWRIGAETLAGWLGATRQYEPA